MITMKILTGDSAITGYPDLYVNGSGNLVYNSGITALYVNGTLFGSNVITLSPNDLYHISVVMNPYSGNLFLNGTSTNAGLAGSYGHINLKQYSSNAWDVSSSYDLFIKNKVSVVPNDNGMNLLSNQVLVDSRKTYAIAHKIGS